MAALSTFTSPILCLGTSFKYKSSKYCPLPTRVFPTLTRMHHRGVSVNRVMNTASEEAVTEGLARRNANHHGNVWDDNFIQSLPKPYDAPCYFERAEVLIGEMKDIFNAMLTPEKCSYLDNIFERLSLVDNIERLEIDHHFRKEIKAALDYVYRYWNEKGIGCGRDSLRTDLNTTAVGLRILRLHRYNVSSDVLEHFIGKDGQFCCTSTEGILNLYRASLIAFPGEKVMEDAKGFTTHYLEAALRKMEISSLSREIEYNLEYGWYTNLPRVEARNYIEIYRENRSWMEKTIYKMPRTSNKILLDLAKLDFNILQSLHQGELQMLSRWWTESNLPKLTFARHRHVEYYCFGAAICVEPKYSAFRIGFAKACALGTCLDDFYDTYGTFDELKIFTDALKRWDPSAAERLPEYMKILYIAFYNGINEMARDAEKTQGYNTLDYARKTWEDNIDAYMQEAKWLADGHLPTLKEFLEVGKVSAGNRTVTVPTVLTLDALLPENILPKIFNPSRFDELLCLALRLKGDIRTFKAEAARGEVTSFITCYMKEHPGSNQQEALNCLHAMLEENLRELNWEYLKSDEKVPSISKDHAYNICRTVQLFYKDGDGFSFSAEYVTHHVMNMLTQPFDM